MLARLNRTGSIYAKEKTVFVLEITLITVLVKAILKSDNTIIKWLENCDFALLTAECLPGPIKSTTDLLFFLHLHNSSQSDWYISPLDH